MDWADRFIERIYGGVAPNIYVLRQEYSYDLVLSKRRIEIEAKLQSKQAFYCEITKTARLV